MPRVREASVLVVESSGKNTPSRGADALGCFVNECVLVWVCVRNRA